MSLAPTASAGRLLPSRALVLALWVATVASAVALLLGLPADRLARWTAGFALLGAAWAGADAWRVRRRWRSGALLLERQLPRALALGVTRPLPLRLTNPGPWHWRGALHDQPGDGLVAEGLPIPLDIAPGAQAQGSYRLTPRQRGTLVIAPALLRLASPGGCWALQVSVGPHETLQGYPNFAAVARYAWLAGDRRLAEIGIKHYARRGQGTDFRQLAEYRAGDPVRHIDWKATLRHTRPVVREYQDNRDQTVLFALDCGRRMRADEGDASPDGSHFDQALNALMLLAHVALRDGDAVGALAFGLPEGRALRFSPTKGRTTLAALTHALHTLQPGTDHPDYLQMAEDVLRHQPRRALVVVLTNLRDEDGDELAAALKLLRSRHLVLLASLRETAPARLAAQPIDTAAQAVEVAAAHQFEQARADALARLAVLRAQVVDVAPRELPAELVNRYRALKRAGRL